MADWHLIVGLGNPGAEYDGTRHNIGFTVVERLAEKWGAGWSTEARFRSRIARVDRGERRVLLCQPQTFMNLSGFAVGAVSGFFQVPPGRVLVVVDDANLQLGVIRLRKSGSSGGHHGLDSIERQLGANGYPRLRIGIGRPSAGAREITGHVLGRFQKEETILLQSVIDRVVRQVECWLDEGVEVAMSKFNGAVNAP